MLQFLASTLGTRNVDTAVGTDHPYMREANVWSPNPSIDPAEYYTPGNGAPAVSASDYYHLDGLASFMPYDLLTMGAEGAAIAATLGKGRYVWLASADHPGFNETWEDGGNFAVGFSDDPGVMPYRMKTLIHFLDTVIVPDPGGGTWTYFFWHHPWLVYNPDAVGNKFFIYGTGTMLTSTVPANAIDLVEGVATTSNFETATMVTITHQTTSFSERTGYQYVYRVATGDWFSVGWWGTEAKHKKYTSTDGLSFTPTGSLLNGYPITGLDLTPFTTDTVSYCARNNSRCPLFEIDGQRYQLIANGTTDGTPGAWISCVMLVALDSALNIMTSIKPIIVTGVYGNYNLTYPGPEYMQNVHGYAEDGILHFNCARGFPCSSSQHALEDYVPYALGGGLWEQFIDRHSYVFDAELAAEAAPCGLRCSCEGGDVDLTWDNERPGTTFRIYRGTTSATQTTSVADVTGYSYTDTLSGSDLNKQWWYKVVTLDGSTERKHRVVHCYASNATEFVNKHITRMYDEGFDTTKIDIPHLIAADALLTDLDLHRFLLWAVDPAFGVKESAGAIQVVACLGTTRMPRQGDWRPKPGGLSTYSATGFNSVKPGVVAASSAAHGYFGDDRVNNIRRKRELTVLACIKKNNSFSSRFLGYGEFQGYSLQYSNDGSAYFFMSNYPFPGTPVNYSAIKAVTGHTTAHVIAGTYDGVDLVCYVDGVAGTAAVGPPGNLDFSGYSHLLGQRTNAATQYFLCTGSLYSKISAGARVYSQNEAAYNWAGKWIFEKALSAEEIAEITDFYQDWGGF